LLAYISNSNIAVGDPVIKRGKVGI